MKNYFVAILMGSESDLPVMQSTCEVLKQIGIPFEIRISSAHRTPEATQQYVQEAQERGCAVFICAAGLAAHLAGFVAAHTVRPVIGIPLESGSLKGMDALLSTVQMPGGVPVACVAIGKAGAKNAAFLSAQILALQYPEVRSRLLELRQENAKRIIEKNAHILEH